MRTEFLVTRVQREDPIPFSAESAETVRAHYKECGQVRNGECAQFFYGVASMFHEKLILDHGLTTYFEWQRQLASTMPKGNPAGFNQRQRDEMAATFSDVFGRVFKYSLTEFETNVVPEYIAQTYKNIPEW